MSEPEAPDGQVPESGAPSGSDSASAEAPASAEAQASASVSEAEPEAGPVKRKHPFYLRGRRVNIRLPKSRVGLFALLLVLGGIGFVGIFAGVSVISWTESADFCGRCHTMAPELQAYSSGVHRNVTCGECHVEPGIAGWVKAKMNGTRQLIDVVLGTYPTPIPPPEHAALPSTEETCRECHSLDQREFVGLRTSESLTEDGENTRKTIGLMIRPSGGDPFNVDRSVHWHVQNDVEYVGHGLNGATIDYVKAKRPDGTEVEFIAQDQVVDAANVTPEIERLTSESELTEVTCYDCHNRVGHDLADPRRSVDYLLQIGKIDDSLPYIKRESQRLLWTAYPDVETANAEIEKLEDFYKVNYPEVYATKLAHIRGAIETLKDLYPRTAVPALEVTPATYPNQMGHQDFPGCFRCHDGGHFKVEDGVATKEAIPSTCNTCHTFPQIGAAVASLPLGEPPSTHEDNLWVFNHKNVAPNLDPGGTSCGECHARDYCVNCHATGAVTVDHDEMATNHAAVIREQGNEACAYCHQPVFCARCHQDPVLPVTSPAFGTQPAGSENGEGDGEAPEGVAWPLNPHAAWNARAAAGPSPSDD
jgi:nitrate/TMAO reductase-like tetraheme cytochrome c subunit